MDTRPIGLTGAIASGKSTVLRMLSDWGLRVASSDAVAREVFREDAFQKRLAHRMGASAPVSSADLRAAMLHDGDLRRWTNQAMHPIVGERTSAMDLDVIEVPLLFEACLQARYREVWVVACGAEEQARRLRVRYGPEVEIGAYVRWQLSEKAKIALGDVVIRTDRTPEDVHRFIAERTAISFPGRVARLG